MKRYAIVLLILGFLQSATLTSAARAEGPASEAQELVERSTGVLGRFLADKKFTWLHENLKNAKAVMMFPRVIRAGFIWGGSGGHGVLVVRDEKGNGWSQPVFYSIGSVSYGLQIGGEEAEVVMLAMSKKATDSLLASSFKFGGDVAVAAGPHGGGAKKILNADFISFARARGLYAGLNFEGSIVKVREDLNKGYYGKEVRPVQVIVERLVSNPASERLLTAVSKAAR